MSNIYVNKEYLLKNPNCIFVFGDNLLRKGYGGAAKLRDMPNTYGFITKKVPDNKDTSFFKPEEYQTIFQSELIRLENEIINNPTKIFLISKLGSGLANKYNIYEKVILPGMLKLRKYINVTFLN